MMNSSTSTFSTSSNSISSVESFSVPNLLQIAALPSANINCENESTTAALVVLHCRPNSHPFNERRISLNDPAGIKIGRSVAKAKPDVGNAIFDCKVLSRNHAVIWYEDGKFWLRDTKSSNGTFVNSQRLSEGNKESLPRQLFSNDIIQYGVDVVENARPGSVNPVTHGCIIAQVSLFHPDGKEAKRNGNALVNQEVCTSSLLGYSQEQVYQLAQYIQEALHREQMLERKLSRLTELLDSTQSTAQNGWQALLNEERLVSRLELLQNQLIIYEGDRSSSLAAAVNGIDSSLSTETQVQIRTERLQWEICRAQYEEQAKESLRHALDEKMEAIEKLTELKRSYETCQEECIYLKSSNEFAQRELTALNESYQKQCEENGAIKTRLEEAQQEQMLLLQKVQSEKLVLLGKLDDVQHEVQKCTAQFQASQAECDYLKNEIAHVNALVAKLKARNNEKLAVNVDEAEYNLEKKKSMIETTASPKDIMKLLEEKENNSKDFADLLKQRQQEVEAIFSEDAAKVMQLEHQLNCAEVECANIRLRTAQIESTLDVRAKLRCCNFLLNAFTAVSQQLQSCDHSYTLIEDEVVWFKNQFADLYQAYNKEVTAEENSTPPLPLEQLNFVEGSEHVEVLERLKSFLLQVCSYRRISETQLTECMNLVASLEQSKNEKDLVVASVSATLAEVTLENEKLHKDVEIRRKEMLVVCNERQRIEGELADALKMSETYSIEATSLQKQLSAIESPEYKELLTECDSLRTKICQLEHDKLSCESERQDVVKQHHRLQEQYLTLEAERREVMPSSSATPTSLADARAQLQKLQQRCFEKQSENEKLQKQLSSLRKDFQALADRGRLITAGAVIPLMVLLLAFMVSLYFTLTNNNTSKSVSSSIAS